MAVIVGNAVEIVTVRASERLIANTDVKYGSELARKPISASGQLGASDAGLVHGSVMFGTFLIVFGTFTASLAREYYQSVLSQGVCIGLGIGIFFYMPGL